VQFNCAHPFVSVALGIFRRKTPISHIDAQSSSKKDYADKRERISNASVHDFCRKNCLITIDVHMRARAPALIYSTPYSDVVQRAAARERREGATSPQTLRGRSRTQFLPLVHNQAIQSPERPPLPKYKSPRPI
jgi:hypothetical protein